MKFLPPTVFRYAKWLLVLILLFFSVKAGFNYYDKQNAKPAFNGSLANVERGDITASIAATGTISAVNSVDVSSKITGRILSVNVNENDRVVAGQVLITLDDTSQQTQVAQTRAQAENTRASYERSRSLAAVGAIAQQQLDADRTAYQVAQANYDNALSSLSDTVIHAPSNGLVIGKPIPAGQTVSPGISNPMVLLTVADMSIMQIQVQVDETDIGNVKTGQKVSFTVDAYPGRIFSGSVTTISQKAVIQQNVIYYTVYVTVDEPQGLLFPTMTARVSIATGERKQVLVIPLSAIKESKGQKYVQRLVDGKEQLFPVTLGLLNDEKAEVLSGLSEGDSIILPLAKGAGATPGTPSMRSLFGR
ncbi:efflux RND transporter periplasmic adaptor subunit [Azotosporobacter soli]|uniref:efflux RND transporter periplasmic adaptor subunit n=1 Tax=Azotosporobacter soli TaxID=3055040 RepID=UPI0031FE5F56